VATAIPPLLGGEGGRTQIAVVSNERDVGVGVGVGVGVSVGVGVGVGVVVVAAPQLSSLVMRSLSTSRVEQRREKRQGGRTSLVLMIADEMMVR
jgi:hypothetical protein